MIEAVRHYCLSLQENDAFLFHSIIRLTTLWFRIMQEPGMNLLEQVAELETIKNYQWYIVLQQLVTVAQHPCEMLKCQVSQILKHVLCQYTEHVVWQIIGMLNVSGTKKDFMMPVGSQMNEWCLMNRLFDRMNWITSRRDYCLRMPFRSPSC